MYLTAQLRVTSKWFISKQLKFQPTRRSGVSRQCKTKARQTSRFLKFCCQDIPRITRHFCLWPVLEQARNGKGMKKMARSSSWQIGLSLCILGMRPLRHAEEVLLQITKHVFNRNFGVRPHHESVNVLQELRHGDAVVLVGRDERQWDGGQLAERPALTRPLALTLLLLVVLLQQ